MPTPHRKIRKRLANRPCGGKRSFDSEVSARMGAQAAISRRRSSDPSMLWVYRCPGCGRWHMTSRSGTHAPPAPVTATALGIEDGK
ncbi:MAG: hypothetical protein K2Y20_13910 [Sphingomonas sp.]|nr:hypothetical protein [Sphingomonas sp.]